MNGLSDSPSSLKDEGEHAGSVVWFKNNAVGGGTSCPDEQGMNHIGEEGLCRDDDTNPYDSIIQHFDRTA